MIRTIAKIQSTPPQPSPGIRGGGKIILVSLLNKGGLAGGEFDFCKNSKEVYRASAIV
ncbi:hypothetical protein MicvaDRAFT_0968 [Microcoleus vaginatus FGP-2]|nr:hypothetical protein MicvaDRAFT_0968 [Microcoleus vaginatus FGP-2]